MSCTPVLILRCDTGRPIDLRRLRAGYVTRAATTLSSRAAPGKGKTGGKNGNGYPNANSGKDENWNPRTHLQQWSNDKSKGKWAWQAPGRKGANSAWQSGERARNPWWYR